MTRLLRVELARLTSRRSLWALAALAVVISIGFAVKTGYDSRPYSADELATARANAAIAAADGQNRADVRACEADPTSFLGPDGTKAACRSAILPSPSSFLQRTSLRLPVVMEHNGLSTALLVLVVIALGAAVFAGADWANGSIPGQLLAEPRRGRVWVAKAGAVAVWAAATALVAMLVFWVPLRVLAAQRPVAVSASLLDLGGYVARVVVLAAVAAVLAYALTMLFRQTVAAIGLLLGIAVAAELLLGLVPVPGTGRLSPSHNVMAWVVGHTRYLDPSVTCAGAECDRIRTLSMWPAGGLMLLVVLLVAAASYVAFRRRDLA